MPKQPLDSSTSWCAFLLLIAAFAGPGLAQDPADEPVLRQEGTVTVRTTLVPEVNSVATKLPIPNRLTPASVSVVAAPLLEQQDARVLGEALRNVSGLNPQTESGVADYFLLRGLDSQSSGLVMTDGAPEPQVTFYQLYNVDRVEVLKGPASFLYGSNPLAGAVNLVRKRPSRDGFVVVTGSAGSFATQEGTLDANWSAPGDRLGLRLNALWERTDGWRDGRGGRVRAANPTLLWRASDRDTVAADFERVESLYQPDSGLPILLDRRVAGVPSRRSYQSPLDNSDQTAGRAQIEWERKAGGLALRDKLYYRGLDWRSNGTLFTGVFPDQTGRLQVNRVLTLLDDRQAFWGNQLEVTATVTRGGYEHRLLAGLEVARRDDTFTLDVGLLPAIDLLAPVETAQGPVFLLPGQSSAADARTWIVSPYVLDDVALSSRLHLLVGARFDRSDLRDGVSRTSRRDSQLSPMVGLLYALSDHLSFYGNAGQGFAPPSTRVAGPRRAETGAQAEAGVKGDLLGGRLRATLAAYQIERRHQAIPDANGLTAQDGGQRSRGVELEVAAEPLPRLFTLLSYAYNDAVLTRFREQVQVSFFPPAYATLDRAGNTPPLAPAHIANLWLTRRLPGGFEISLGGRYTSSQFIAADNAFAIPAAFTADAALSYSLGRLKAHLNAKNLTDKRTYTRGFGSTSVIPASGFALYAGIDVLWAPATDAVRR